jgi:hypothetical protein
MAIRQVRRKVEWAEHREHAMRLVAHGDPAKRGFHAALGRALRIRIDRDFDLADHGIEFGARLPERFPRFARNQVGEGVHAMAHDVGEAAQRLDAHGERPRRPARPTGARGRDLRSTSDTSPSQSCAPVAGSWERRVGMRPCNEG